MALVSRSFAPSAAHASSKRKVTAQTAAELLQPGSGAKPVRREGDMIDLAEAEQCLPPPTPRIASDKPDKLRASRGPSAERIPLPAEARTARASSRGPAGRRSSPAFQCGHRLLPMNCAESPKYWPCADRIHPRKKDTAVGFRRRDADGCDRDGRAPLSLYMISAVPSGLG